MIGAGFLVKPEGALVWLEGLGGARFAPPRRIPVPDARCWYHEVLPLDLDADGDLDFITTCHVKDPSESRLEWFENPGGGGDAFVHHAAGAGAGALITLFDVDGDGDGDVIAPQFFEHPSLVWFEQTARGSFTRRVVDDSTGRGFVVRLADVNGDGRTDLVYGNHNNEVASTPSERVMGIYWFEVPPASALAGLGDWSAYRHAVFEGFTVAGDDNGASAGAPGMLSVGDLDGDCDIDITASGDGDLGLYAFLSGTKGFQQLVLDTDARNLNSGEQHVLDLDADGDADIAWAVFGPNDPAQLLVSGLDSAVYAFVQD